MLLSTGSLRAVEVAALPAALSGFLEKHCHVCHADDEAESGLDLAGLGLNLSDAEVMRQWVLVHDRIAAGEMPPDGQELPESEKKNILNQLGRLLHQSDAVNAMLSCVV